MEEGREAVGGAHSSDENRDNITLSERRGSALTDVFNEGRDSRLEKNLPTTDKVREFQRKLYLKAKSQPNFRFYVLYDKIYRTDVLNEAWRRLNKQGAPGIDGQTIKDIGNGGVDEFIKGIQEELKSGEYRPQPTRRVYIPKPDGRQRPLSIPTVKDRVIQMAVKIVIEPIFESDFEDNSYGFRPKRSGQEAVKEIRKYLNYGMTEVIDADLEDCFGSIPHKELLDIYRRDAETQRIILA